MAGRPTIKTIAKIAGVSHVAVSKALRDAPDISIETKQRILQIAREVGYTPNAAARNLNLRKTNTIGMIVPAIGENTSYNAVFNEISAVAATHGCSVMLGSSHRSLELEERHCRLMCENRVGALIVASVSSDLSRIKAVCGDLMPIIFIGGKTDPAEQRAVLCDYRHSAELVVEHLAGLGHRDIALFTYGPDNLTIRQKEEGFIAAMTNRGFLPVIYREGDAANTAEAGATLAQRLLDEKKLPTAIWCASDLMALGVLSTLRKAGVRVPEDVSLVGHDDLYFGTLPNVALTTLHIPMDELGRHAVQLALSLMGELDRPVAEHKIFQTRLVVRGTTNNLS